MTFSFKNKMKIIPMNNNNNKLNNKMRKKKDQKYKSKTNGNHQRKINKMKMMSDKVSSLLFYLF